MHFSRTQKVLISHSTSSHRSNVQCNWCSQNTTLPAKKIFTFRWSEMSCVAGGEELTTPRLQYVR